MFDSFLFRLSWWPQEYPHVCVLQKLEMDLFWEALPEHLSSIWKEDKSTQLELLCLFQSSFQILQELWCFQKSDLIAAKILSQASTFHQVLFFLLHTWDRKKKRLVIYTGKKIFHVVMSCCTSRQYLVLLLIT